MLVDKQRSEYMHAYEHHMIDVQRELHNLREKATAIANDTTREEKIKKLDSDQKWFRNEAMRLDVDTNVYRKKMRDIKVLIQSTGEYAKATSDLDFIDCCTADSGGPKLDSGDKSVTLTEGCRCREEK